MEKDLYFIYGLAIALSLLHGNPAPRFFSEILYSQVFGGEKKYMESVSLVSSLTVRNKILKVG